MVEVVDPALVASLKNFKDDCLERFLSEEIVEEKLSAFIAEIKNLHDVYPNKKLYTCFSINAHAIFRPLY